MAGLLELPRLFHQQSQIGNTLFSGRQAAAVVKITRIIKQYPHEFFECYRVLEFFPVRYLLQHSAELFFQSFIRPTFCISLHRLVKAAVTAFYPDCRKLLDREVEHRASHNGYQRYVLIRIVYHAQEIREYLDFHCLEVSARVFAESRHAFVVQEALQRLYARSASGKHDDIAVLHISVHALLYIIYLFSETFTDQLQYHLLFGLRIVIAAAFRLLRLRYDDMAFRFDARIRSVHSTLESGIPVVSVHYALEHGVDSLSHCIFAPEIVAQVDLDAFLFGFLCIKRIFCSEYLRLGQPELVDALLDVAHHEQIVFSCDPPYDRLLQHVAVLELVYEYVSESVAVLRRHQIITEYIDGIMHDIIKIYDVLIGFFLLEYMLKVLYESCEVSGIIVQQVKLLVVFAHASLIISAAQIVQYLLAVFSQRRHVVFNQGIVVLLVFSGSHLIEFDTVQESAENTDTFSRGQD